MMPRVVVASVCLAITLFVFIGGARDHDAALVRQIESTAAGNSGSGLFVHAGGEIWYQPLAVFPSAVLLRAGIPRDAALVIPALIGAYFVVWLTYALAVRVPLASPYPALTAVMLLFMPGYVEHARAAGADLLMVAAILGWCVLLLESVRRPSQWLPFVGGVVLAAAAYTQPAGVLTVPVFLLLGAVLLRRAGLGWRPVLASVAGAGVGLLPIAIWLALHPAAYPDTFGRWAIHAAHVRNPIDGLIALTRWHVVARRASDYWDYFNPTFLFASGQVFALWVVVLMPLGLWASGGRRRTHGQWLATAAFFVAPVAAVLLDVSRAPSLVLTLIPFGVVLAAMGLDGLKLWAKSARLAAAITVVALGVIELTRLAK